MSQTVEWIGVAEVAAELNLTPRAAWEMVRRLKVPMIEPSRATLARARFRRSDWEEARDAALRPASPRAAKPAPAPTPPKQSPAAAAANVAAKLARLRG